MHKKGNTKAIKQKAIAKVDLMKEYCMEGTKCRHAHLLDYFGEPFRQRECSDTGGPGVHRCDNCGCRVTGERLLAPFPFPEEDFSLVGPQKKPTQRKRKGGASQGGAKGGQRRKTATTPQAGAPRQQPSGDLGGGGRMAADRPASFTAASAFVQASSMMQAGGSGAVPAPARTSRGTMLASLCKKNQTSLPRAAPGSSAGSRGAGGPPTDGGFMTASRLAAGSGGAPGPRKAAAPDELNILTIENSDEEGDWM